MRSHSQTSSAPGAASGGLPPRADGRLAAVSLALGIAAVAGSIVVVGAAAGAAGLATGIPARLRARRAGASTRVATAGIVLSALSIVLAAAAALGAVWLAYRTRSCYHLRSVHLWFECAREQFGRA